MVVRAWGGDVNGLEIMEGSVRSEIGRRHKSTFWSGGLSKIEDHDAQDVACAVVVEWIYLYPGKRWR